MQCCRRLEVIPACKTAHEHQRDDDLYEHNGHHEQWMAGKVGLGAGNRRRQERRVSQIADDNEREQTSAALIDAPAENSVSELNDESCEWSGFIKAPAELRRWQSWPQHDVMAVRQKIKDQMGYDSEPNRSAQYCAAETLLDDQPGGKSSDERSADRVGVGHVREMYISNAANRGLGSRSFNAKVVECNPGQLHGLGDKERRHRGEGKRRLTNSAVAAWSIANMGYL